MIRTRVGVLRGGPSAEYEVSLETGKAVLENLSPEKYDVKDIFIDRSGKWHHRGVPVTPKQLFGAVDVFFIALHGTYGEDGQVQKMLEEFNVPYTGSQALASAIGMNKIQTKETLRTLSLQFPEHVVLEVSDDIKERIQAASEVIPAPWVTKPLALGSSVGVSVNYTFDELMRGVGYAFQYAPQIVIEEYISGKEATCTVIDHFRGEERYTPFPIEIVPSEGRSFFDYDAKYKGKSKELCPGRFSPTESAKLQYLAQLVHERLNLRHYSRSDFIVAKDGIYFLEVNTLPGLTSESLVPKSLEAVGSNLPEFLDHVVTLAKG